MHRLAASRLQLRLPFLQRARRATRATREGRLRKLGVCRLLLFRQTQGIDKDQKGAGRRKTARLREEEEEVEVEWLWPQNRQQSLAQGLLAQGAIKRRAQCRTGLGATGEGLVPAKQALLSIYCARTASHHEPIQYGAASGRRPDSSVTAVSAARPIVSAMHVCMCCACDVQK